MSDLLGLIDAEQIYRGATPSCPTSEFWPVPLEVLGPAVNSRIEERDQFIRFGIVGRLITALEGIAREAAPAEVRQLGRPVVLLGPDVVELEGSNVEFLRHAAVLADVACPLPHLIANRLRHDSVGTTGGLLQGQPGLGLQEIDKAADSHIPLQFVAPLWRDLSLLVLLGQSTHMVCGLVAELPAEH